MRMYFSYFYIRTDIYACTVNMLNFVSQVSITMKIVFLHVYRHTITQ